MIKPKDNPEPVFFWFVIGLALGVITVGITGAVSSLASDFEWWRKVTLVGLYLLVSFLGLCLIAIELNRRAALRTLRRVLDKDWPSRHLLTEHERIEHQRIDRIYGRKRDWVTR